MILDIKTSWYLLKIRFPNKKTEKKVTSSMNVKKLGKKESYALKSIEK